MFVSKFPLIKIKIDYTIITSRKGIVRIKEKSKKCMNNYKKCNLLKYRIKNQYF